MKPFHSSPNLRTRRLQRSRGFTLIEIMVALAIFMLMLTIILVPINMGARITHIGTARADVQQSSQQLLNRIANELRQAVYVFPNDALPGVTDRAPYINNKPVGSQLGYPYYQQTAASTDVCGGTLTPVGNTSRIDFLLPKRNGNVLLTPVVPEYYMVTYFARRLDSSKPWNQTPNTYHPVDNPIVMYRAQYPYRANDGSTFLVSGNPNVQTNGIRYPTTTDCTNAAPVNRGALWLTQNAAGEPNLVGGADLDKQPAVATNLQIIQDTTATAPSNLQLVTPRDMGLIAPRASLPNVDPSDTTKPLRSFLPATTFIVDDTNDDGKIDRVSLNLVLGQFDSGGSEPRDQRVRLPMTLDLPNIR